MSDILYELYSGNYEIGIHQGEEEEKISREIVAMLDEIRAKMGGEFVDRLSNLYADRGTLANYRYYRDGFSLGVRLMLEVFMPA